MGEGLARAITIGSIVLTVASLGLAVVFARKKTRIRIGFDLTRAVVGIGAILVMAMATSVTTSTLAVLLAVAGGLALGFTQGSSLEISSGERGFYARRSPVAVVLWGTGIVVMQAAGLASRTGAVRLGQTIAWFSACLGVGLLVGRTGPMRRTVTGAGVAAVVLAIALPTAAFIAGTETPAAAQTIQLTDEEVCALTPANRNTFPGFRLGYDGGITGEFSFWRAYYPAPPDTSETAVETAIAGCLSQGFFEYTGSEVEFFVYLFASADEALTRWQSEATMGNEWYAGWSQDSAGDDHWDTTLTYNAGGLNEFGVAGAWFSVGGAEDRVVIHAGPFLLYGVADNLGFDLGEKGADGYRRPITLIEELITPMVETVRNIEALLTEAPPPPDDAPPPSDDIGIPPPGDAAPTDDVAGVPPADESGALPVGEDEPIEPEEAAAQAIAGLIAAAAIGLITWAEAGAGIGQILGGLGGGGAASGAPLPEPPGPFIDPYDQTELEVDPETGMVFWPWDGREGRWVDPFEVPALIDEWDRELDAETARRVGQHNAQAHRDWEDLRRRSKEDARAERDWLDAARERRRKEQAVADSIRDIAEEVDFDQMVAWLDENPSPTSEQLDALRAALGRQIGAKQAIDDLPDTGELVREAIRRTMGADAEWDKDHVTWADVADFIGQRGLGTALRNPELAARVGAAMATGGWSEAAVIPLVDVPRALEQANAARTAAGLPDLTADEARFVSNVTIIKAITIDQALERGIPLAGRMLGGGGRAAREAAQEALDASMRRGGSAASDAMGTTAVRSLPGDEALGRSLDDGFGASGRDAGDGMGSGGDDFGTLGRGDTGGGSGSLDEGLRRSDTVAPDEGIQLPQPREGSVPTQYGDQPVMEPGTGIPGRQAPSGHFPPQPPRGSVDDLARDAGAHQESLGGPGVQPQASVTPPRVDPETGPFDGRPQTPPREIPPQIDDGGFKVGTPPAEGPPGFGPEFGPRTTINRDVTPGLGPRDLDTLREQPASVGEIKGIKAVEDAMNTGSVPPPTVPRLDPPPTPRTPVPEPPAPKPPTSDTPANQEAMEAALRGESPPGSDNLQLVDSDRFVGTGHAGQGGWSPEALLREERFWRSDGTPILGPEAVDVQPLPKGFILQVNPRTRTVTANFGDALTPTQKARLKRPGGPIDQAARRINKTLDDLENPS